MTNQPTPDELAQRMRDFDPSVPNTKDRMASIIADAEAGGIDHMTAVIDALPGADPTPPPPRPDGLIMGSNGRARYRDNDFNVRMEVRVKIDGRVFCAREIVDPFLWEGHFGQDSDRFKSFTDYFLRRSFGAVADDPEMGRVLRERLFVVRPTDEHDIRVCRRTAEQSDTWPRCLNGVILSELPGVSPIPGAGALVAKDTVLGSCRCRCHSHLPDWQRHRFHWHDDSEVL